MKKYKIEISEACGLPVYIPMYRKKTGLFKKRKKWVPFKDGSAYGTILFTDYDKCYEFFKSKGDVKLTMNNEGGIIVYLEENKNKKIMKNKLIIDGKEIDLPQELIDEIKGKLPNKEKEKEQFFLDCFNGCEILLRDGSVYYKKDGEVIMEQDSKNDYFWFHYSKIWSVFETKYSMTHDETQRFFKSMLDLHLKLGSCTSHCCWSCLLSRWTYI